MPEALRSLWPVWTSEGLALSAKVFTPPTMPTTAKASAATCARRGMLSYLYFSPAWKEVRVPSLRMRLILRGQRPLSCPPERWTMHDD